VKRRGPSRAFRDEMRTSGRGSGGRWQLIEAELIRARRNNKGIKRRSPEVSLQSPLDEESESPSDPCREMLRDKTHDTHPSRF